MKGVPTLKPELASFNFGSMNFGVFPLTEQLPEFKFPWEKPLMESTRDSVSPNTFKTLEEFSRIFAENGTKGELEVYDAGMINNIAFMLQTGHLKRPVYVQFVLGALGGMLASPDNLLFLRNTACEALGDFTWSVCAAGRHQFPMCTMALTMGGNARVGLEDNLFISKRQVAKSNAEQVEKIVRIARELSPEHATPDEAREFLGLKGPDKVNR